LARYCLLLLLLATVLPSARPGDRRVTEIHGVNTHYFLRAYESRSQWEARRVVLRKQILSSAGLNPLPPRTPLNARIARHIENEFASIDTLLIDTLPGFHLGANLYSPLKPKKKMPAVLVPHGHWKNGRVENKPEYSVPALAMNLARQGYVVLTYDMIGYNDTTQLPHDFITPEGQLWSYTPLGLQLWNSMRALDYLLSLPGVDQNRVAATGASGGGTQTFLLTAVDDRIRYSAPVNMISAYMQGGDPCEEAPGLRLDTFNVEIAALTAPRPMLMVSCTKDWTKHTPEEEFPALRNVYKLYGHEDRAHNAHIDAEHNYNAESREAVYRFLARHMQPRLATTELKDREIGEIRPDDLLAHPDPNAPGSLQPAQLFQQWKAISREQTEAIQDKEELRERLRLVLRAEYPHNVESAIDESIVALTRPEAGDRVLGFWRPGKRDPVIVAHPGGIDRARESSLVKGLLQSDRAVFLLENFQAGVERVQATYNDRNFYGYNLSNSAIEVQNILTALAFVKAHATGKPQIIGVGSAGVPTLFAAAVAPVESELIVDINGFAGTDEDFKNTFFVPGIQRAGGLQAALRLTGSLHTLARFEPRNQRSRRRLAIVR
jgi:dienelactone hydrolase